MIVDSGALMLLTMHMSMTMNTNFMKIIFAFSAKI